MTFRKLKVLKLGIAFAIVAGTLAALTVYNFVKARNQVSRDEINIYVCELVKADSDSNMLGLRCMAKKEEK